MPNNSVKMVSLIDGEPVEVGRCHPGQARLLQKKGIAEWKEGRLWLRDVVQPDLGNLNVEGATETLRSAHPPEDPPVTFGGLEKLIAEKDVESHVIAQVPERPLDPEYIEAILVEAGVEPGPWVKEIRLHKPRVHLADVEVASWPVFLRTFLERVGLGHKTWSCDDVPTRRVGFIDVTTDEYLCVRASGMAAITDRDATPFQMTRAELVEKLSTQEGRQAVFGESDFGGTLADLDEEPVPEALWGTVPNAPEEVLPRVSAHGVTDPLVFPSLQEGETPSERLERVRKSREGAYQPRHLPGWTHFRWPECHEAIPVLAPVDEKGTLAPFPKLPEVPVNPPGTPLAGFKFPTPSQYGVYRRVNDRLIRVWADGAVWDESLLQEDDTYLLVSEHRKIDAVTVGNDISPNLLAPAGFLDQVAEAEKRVTELLE